MQAKKNSGKTLIWTQPHTIPLPPSKIGDYKQQKTQRQQQIPPNQRSQVKPVSCLSLGPRSIPHSTSPRPQAEPTKQQTQLPYETSPSILNDEKDYSNQKHDGEDEMEWMNRLPGDDFTFDLLSDDAFLNPTNLLSEASSKELSDYLDASKRLSTVMCDGKGNGEDDSEPEDTEEEGGSGDTEEDFSGYNALHLAVSIGQVGTVRLLLQMRPADIDQAAEGGQRRAPLHIASARYHVDVVRILLDHGANARLQDGRGCTPLHVAVRAGAHAISRLLLCWCVELLHMRDAAGRTPLHDAIIKGDEKTVRLLLDYGADPAAVVAQNGAPGYSTAN